METLEIGDIVMCTVERIEGTMVFVKIEGNGQGKIVLSEIAPGRIRNLREYVVPKKRIVCKVIRISNNQIDLSLRRVTKKEQEELIDQGNLERSYKSVLKTILKENTEKAIEDILKEDNIYNFLQESKKNPKKLEDIVGKENAKKILQILNSQKQKEVAIKKEFFLKSTKPDGLTLIKEILGQIKEAEINYLAAGKYSIKTKAENLKIADKKLKEILENLENNAKRRAMEFSIKEK